MITINKQNVTLKGIKLLFIISFICLSVLHFDYLNHFKNQVF